MSRIGTAVCWSAVAAAILVVGAARAQEVELDQAVLQANEIRVFDRGGTRVLEPNVQSVRLDRGALLSARVAETAQLEQLANSSKFEMPFRLIAFDAVGQQLDLRAVVEVVGFGFRARPDSGLFVGLLRVGIEDRNKPTQSSPLGRTIHVQVNAAADHTDPSQLEIDHTNLPFTEVKMEARRPGETVQVEIRYEFDPEPVGLAVPVIRPELRLHVSPQSIQGFGLETADVTVRALDPDLGASRVVTLSSDLAKPEPSNVTLNATGTATAHVRSIGTGTATITATSDLLQSATAQVRFVKPWAFVVSALLGGFLGGVIRFLQLKMKDRKKILFVPLVAHVLLGVAAGFLTATAYAVGVNLLDVYPLAKVGEALVFVLSALGAVTSGPLVGKILDRFSKPAT